VDKCQEVLKKIESDCNCYQQSETKNRYFLCCRQCFKTFFFCIANIKSAERWRMPNNYLCSKTANEKLSNLKENFRNFLDFRHNWVKINNGSLTLAKPIKITKVVHVGRYKKL